MHLKAELLFSLAATLSLSACEQSPPATGTEAADAEIVGPENGPTPVPAADLLISERSPTLTFQWRVPAEVAQHPALLTTLREEALTAQEKMQTAAREDAQFRAEQGLDARAIVMRESWELAWENAELLNLVTKNYTYTGGAHPNSVYRSVLWDKQEAQRLKPADLFRNWPEARDEIEVKFCDTLNDERKIRRGSMTLTGKFGSCPELSEVTAVIMGEPYGSFLGLKLLVSPYVAGPYAEGSYEIEFPFDDVMRAKVKAKYLPPA